MQRFQAALAQCLHVTQGTGNNPITQGHDQAALLGQWHELTGWQQPALGMAPAHQRLQANNAPVSQVQAGLIVQLQFVAAQGAAQLAFQVSKAAGVAVDAFVEHMEGAALAALGLTHGDVRVPHQRIGAALRASMCNAQAAAQQQAFAVDPVGLCQGLDDALGNPFGAIGIATGVDQQGELVATQTCQLVARLQLMLQPCHHLQDQPVTALVAQGVVDVAEVVQVQVAKRDTTAFVFGQACIEQSLEALAVGDAGQRVLLGKALQGGDQHPSLSHMAQ